MKLFRILKTNISDSFKGVFRNFSLSLASISCITITLLIVGLSMLLSVNVNNLTDEIEKDMTIVVFLERKLDQENITYVAEKIKKLDVFSLLLISFPVTDFSLISEIVLK